MQENDRPFDDWYREHANYFSQPSGGLIELIREYSIRPCSAIDVGCGQGRNALALAAMGFSVSAVDISSSAIESLQSTAKQLNLEVDAQIADIRTFDFGRARYGLVVAQTTLNHLEPSTIKDCCIRIRQSIKQNGYLYCVVFTTEDPGYLGQQSASECSDFVKYYFKEKELLKSFSDLEVIYSGEYIKLDESHGPKHLHGKAKLFGRAR